MTKKHFIATAKIIAQIADPDQRHETAKAFANIFASENRLFDRARFMQACNVIEKF